MFGGDKPINPSLFVYSRDGEGEVARLRSRCRGALIFSLAQERIGLRALLAWLAWLGIGDSTRLLPNRLLVVDGSSVLFQTRQDKTRQVPVREGADGRIRLASQAPERPMLESLGPKCGVVSF